MTDKEYPTDLFSYVITHDGDPILRKGKLVFGVENCLKSKRNYIKENYLVMGTLGKKPSRDFMEIVQGDYTKYLVYAMKVNKVKTNGNRELISNNFFLFFNEPIRIKSKFHIFIKEQRSFKHFPHKKTNESDKKLINEFWDWLNEQECDNSKDGFPNSTKCKKQQCKKSASKTKK